MVTAAAARCSARSCSTSRSQASTGGPVWGPQCGQSQDAGRLVTTTICAPQPGQFIGNDAGSRVPGLDVRSGVTAQPWAEAILRGQFLSSRITCQVLDQFRNVIACRSGDALDVHLELARFGVDGEIDLGHDQ